MRCGSVLWHGWEKKYIEGSGAEIQQKETTWPGRQRWEDDIKMDLKEIGQNRVTELLWLSKQTSSRILWEL